MTELDFPEESFDAVVCVFDIFFVPDMVAQMAELWRLVRPGGALAITSWGMNSFEPGHSSFWEAVGVVRPDLVSTVIPWERLADSESLSALFQAAGAAVPTVVAEPGAQPLRRVDTPCGTLLAMAKNTAGRTVPPNHIVL